MKKISLFSFILLFISCGGDDFKQRSELDGLRILAVTSDIPEANQVGAISITPLLSDVNGEGRTLNYEYSFCPDPGINFGAEINCSQSLLSLKEEGSGSFDLSTLAASFYTGTVSSITINITSQMLGYLSNLNAQLQFNGADFLFILTLRDPNTNETKTAYRVIKLTSKETSQLNTNPTLGNIVSDNNALSSFPTGEIKLDVSNLSVPESYVLQTNVGLRSFTEDAYVSWYSNAGEFLFNRTDPNEENTFKPSKESGVIVAVYRDGRGGVSFEVLSL